MPMRLIILMVMGFGVIAIVHGVGFQDPSYWADRWLSYLLGAVFMIVALFAMITCNRSSRIPVKPEDRGAEILIGASMALLAAVGAIYAAIVFPFDADDWLRQAWWIGWVYVAGLIWFAILGVILTLDGFIGSHSTK